MSILLIQEIVVCGVKKAKVSHSESLVFYAKLAFKKESIAIQINIIKESWQMATKSKLVLALTVPNSVPFNSITPL